MGDQERVIGAPCQHCDKKKISSWLAIGTIHKWQNSTCDMKDARFRNLSLKHPVQINTIERSLYLEISHNHSVNFYYLYHLFYFSLLH